MSELVSSRFVFPFIPLVSRFFFPVPKQTNAISRFVSHPLPCCCVFGAPSSFLLSPPIIYQPPHPARALHHGRPPAPKGKGKGPAAGGAALVYVGPAPCPCHCRALSLVVLSLSCAKRHHVFRQTRSLHLNQPPNYINYTPHPLLRLFISPRTHRSNPPLVPSLLNQSRRLTSVGNTTNIIYCG